MKKIDQFFKDKLEEHSLPPSEGAWTKIESNLSKKNNIAIWRIAAAIVLAGALLSSVIWSLSDEKNNEQRVAVKKSDKDSIREKSASKITSIEKEEPIKKDVKKFKARPGIEPSQAKNKVEQKENGEIKPAPSLTNASIEPTVAEAINKSAPPVVESAEEKEKIVTHATATSALASTHRKPIKLEFTLDDVSSERPVATASAEKSSGLKKVWNLAIDVKNGDGPVQEIKNELFALNFKKNKNQ